MEVPLAIVYALSQELVAERVLVPGAVISGLIRLLPSTRNRSAAAKASNGIRASIQSSHCVRCLIKRWRIDTVEQRNRRYPLRLPS